MDARAFNGLFVWTIRDPCEDRQATISRTWFLAKGGAGCGKLLSIESRTLARCATAHALLGCGYDDAVMHAILERA